MTSSTDPYEGAAISAQELEREAATRRAKRRRVVCAANRLRDHPLCIVIGPRHHDPVMREQIRVFVQTGGGHTAEAWRSSQQGFIDQWGTFMTREEALVVALAANQRLYRCGGDETALFSENLY